MKTKILIAGGSGLIGRRLSEFLPFDNFEIRVLSTNKSKVSLHKSYFYWDPLHSYIDHLAFQDIDVIVNLAGAGISEKRWTGRRKKIIQSSRIKSVESLGIALQKCSKKPVMIGASAIGIYGDREEEKLTEYTDVGQGFLADVTYSWEQSYSAIESVTSRMVLLRIGIVLSHNGGALKEILKSTKLGMYSYFGKGAAYYSWIHIDDICNIILKAILDNKYRGVYNAVAPHPVSNKHFIKKIKENRGKAGFIFGVPAFLLKLILGELSEMLLSSAYVVPTRLSKEEYRFLYPELDQALEDILKRKI